MKKNSVPLTVEVFEEVLDKKLEEVLDRKLEEVLDRKFDEKLKPIKKDISSLKTDVSDLKTNVSSLKTDVSSLKTDVSVLKTDVSDLKSDLSNVKDVLENRVYKEMKEGFRYLNKKIDRLEEVNLANQGDHDDHETRILRLEKHAGISPKN
jgi:predicted RNase H-like nuclease (RuvC/YqgF family)